MRSMARLFFGKAITSRMLCSPQISITSRSKPNAIPPCGGAPSRNARSKWPNCDSRASAADPKRFEHFFLQLRFVDSHAAAADFNAVQHNVVSLGANLGKFLRLKQRHVLGFRSSEWMMHRVPFVFVRTPFEKRKICDPKEIPVRLRSAGIYMHFAFRDAQA